jgi:hypothetical protein
MIVYDKYAAFISELKEHAALEIQSEKMPEISAS